MTHLQTDLLAAYDAAMEALAASPHDIRLKHRVVLTLARAGATPHARREYLALGLDAVTDDEDVLALGGRILKDLCLAAEGDARRKLAALSAAKYLQAYSLHHGTYPGINTATMFLIAGERAKAHELAAAVLAKVGNLPALGTGEEAYYAKATLAEAALLTGNIELATTALADAVTYDPDNLLARSSTLRQFQIICAAQGQDAAWLSPYRPPPAIFFSGHMYLEQATADAKNLEQTLHTTVEDIGPGAGFGALAAGCDIIIAEALLAYGADVHVVLPFREAEFLAQSVRPFGASWEARYHAVRARAASFRLATTETTFSDDSVFTFGADYAMGLAIHHAAMLGTHAVHVAAWDGAGASALAGTATDIARWNALGLQQIIVSFPAILRKRPAPVTPPESSSAARSVKAILFGDVRGFSKLDETHIRAFVDHIMAPLAHTVHAHTVQPALAATWGDGFHLVYDSVEDAAAAALAAQERFASLDLAQAGLPAHLALRIGGHVGPVAALTDPFLKAPSFYGTQITLAARIEPVAVPGTVYVSEPFAALLAMTQQGQRRFRTDYAGQVELAKNYGALRLFALRRDRTH
ncbi:MAG: DUF4071 domain-containing protein [Rhodospirillaceae bacterium]|nr:DUF4071 domain-containing protein [Rhodospirillaceae bacterium]